MIRVKLFGQPTSTYAFTKSAILKETSRAGIELELQEINDVNEFIKEGIKSVPTIKINNHVEINYSNEKEFTQFLRDSIQSILKEEDFGEMNKIVVPTDFSECSQNALLFALKLFEKRQAVIKMVHAYHPISADVNGVSVIDPHVKEQKMEQFVELLKTVQHQYPQESLSPYMDDALRLGYASDEIVRMSKSEEANFIIMGNTGKGQTLKNWFGSVSIEVSKKAHCPVLIIPPDAHYRGFKNVVYASDHANLDFVVLQNLADFLAHEDYVLHLTHVSSNKNSPENHKRLADMIRATIPDKKIVTKTLPDGDVAYKIYEYARDQKADLIVMAKEKRSLWKDVLHKSSTRKMAIHSDLPVLIYHEDDKECRCGAKCKKKSDDSCS